MPLAVSIGPLPLTPSQRYVWKLEVDDQSDEERSAIRLIGFYVHSVGVDESERAPVSPIGLVRHVTDQSDG